MNEEKKIEIVKEFLTRYGDQQHRVDWAKRKIDGLKMIMADGEDSDDDTEIELKEDVGYSAAKEKFDAEKIKLCKLYSEITDSLDHLTAEDQRDILYGVYIDLYTQEDYARHACIHPKTVYRKHKQALLSLYDIIHP